MIDLSNVTSSYTHYFIEHKDELSSLCTKLQKSQIGIIEFKSTVLNMITDATNTPAKQRFQKNFQKSTNAQDLVFMVYNSILAGSNCAVIK